MNISHNFQVLVSHFDLRHHQSNSFDMMKKYYRINIMVEKKTYIRFSSIQYFYSPRSQISHATFQNQKKKKKKRETESTVISFVLIEAFFNGGKQTIVILFVCGVSIFHNELTFKAIEIPYIDRFNSARAGS